MISYFPSLLQQYIYISRYSRFLHDKQRREMWPETVARYFDFFTIHLKEKHGFVLTKELRKELEDAILGFKIMPSMRCLMTAGEALQRENIAGFNCAFAPVDNQKVFGEILYVLMNGTGIGFSVESQFVNKLPDVPDELYPTDTVIIVRDSKLGWAKGLNELISLLYTGHIPTWDLSKLRPAGAILKTFGGRSSGPAPLDRLFKFVVQTFQNNKGQKLTTLNCHDICCMIGECVVVGGVRRSALISLSDLSDDLMREAKTGNWYKQNPHRRNSNNSAVYTEKQPSMASFMKEWKSLYDSKSGERGIFSRYATRNCIERSNKFRVTQYEKIKIRDPELVVGCNPCVEVNLRADQLCNLTSTIVRTMDTLATLKKKVELAAILGTFQSTLTDFRFVSKRWKINTEDERLLGVSLTGIMDNLLLSGQLGEEELKDALTELKKIVIQTNIKYAKLIGIEPSTATTVVKPEGTNSTMNDTASGIHTRHAPYYLRTVRSDKKDPLAQLMIDQGLYVEDDVTTTHNYVFTFPIKSPENALFRDKVSAIDHLKLWLIYQKYWTEHKPSITVSVKEHEWMKVGSFVYDNFEWMSGVAFLPYVDSIYDQMPFQEIDEPTYKDWMKKMPEKIDWGLLTQYEKADMTTGSQELACVSGGCEL